MSAISMIVGKVSTTILLRIPDVRKTLMGTRKFRASGPGALHLEKTKPGAPGWFSAMWTIESVQNVDGAYVRIRNRWKPDQYLNVEHGQIESGDWRRKSG
jgi:hypothetical protein